MPRGGGGGMRGGGMRGGFGGGMRGGSFGGGFRGGGFRGGPATFRSGSFRPSGTPFGRTGSTRIVSRSPSGPYRHTYYRPYGRYWYGYGYYPWYRRWWYSPWWSGYWYRPWYYSPMYVGGGLISILVIALIFLPLMGVALWFPFSSADTNGTVTYRSTETLYYNEYWYEYEYVKAGNQITFSAGSSPSLISFAIWDQPFENLPLTNVIGGDADSFPLASTYYEYYSIFLNPGSTINYDFNATAPVDFFIADGNDLYYWNQGGSPVFYVDAPNTTSESGFFVVPSAQDYYIVWYNEGVSSVTVDYTVNYNALNVPNLSVADFSSLAVYTVPQQTFTVPNDGNWYFFVYFDPMYSPEETTSITFDVTYNTGITAADRWIDLQPILIGILVVVIIIIIIAAIARRSQKKLKTNPPPETAAKPTEKETAKTTPSKCVRCGTELRAGANFCPSCGGAVEGRILGDTGVTTPAEAKTCSYCGSKIEPDDKFCKWCGTKVETQHF